MLNLQGLLDWSYRTFLNSLNWLNRFKNVKNVKKYWRRLMHHRLTIDLLQTTTGYRKPLQPHCKFTRSPTSIAQGVPGPTIIITLTHQQAAVYLVVDSFGVTYSVSDRLHYKWAIRMAYKHRHVGFVPWLN